MHCVCLCRLSGEAALPEQSPNSRGPRAVSSTLTTAVVLFKTHVLNIKNGSVAFFMNTYRKFYIICTTQFATLSMTLLMWLLTEKL